MFKIYLVVFILLNHLSTQAYASSSKVLQEDQYLEFARGNKIHFKKGSEVNYRNDGSILYIFSGQSPQKLARWTTQQGIEYNLHCGEKLNRKKGDDLKPSLIWFYPSGEYHRGCVAITEFPIITSQVTGFTSFNSAVELSEDGSLQYLSSIQNGRADVLNEQLQLKERSEVYFYKGGNLNFFTPEKNQTYTSPTRYGNILFLQQEPMSSVLLFANGIIKQGVIGESKMINNVRISKGSKLFFEQSKLEAMPYLESTTLSENYVVTSKLGYKVHSSIIVFSNSGSIKIVKVAKNFKFTSSINNEIINVKVGDKVHFNEERKIVKINFSAKR